MSARHTMAKGFTLVEILIVVVILGILAAIVIPQFTSASETARAASLQSQLQTLRSQLELYQVQHNGDYPPLVTDTDWDKMTGTTGQDGAETGTAFGPYLQKAPVNAFTGGSGLAADNSADWQYTETTGAIVAVLPESTFDDIATLGIDASDVVEGPSD